MRRLITRFIWIVSSLWFATTQALEDNLQLTGTLVNGPCVLAAEDELIELDFKRVIDKELYLNGRTQGQPIQLHLQSCDLEAGQRMVNITFQGAESTEVPGLLAVQSTDVKGLLIGLESAAGTLLPLNTLHRMGVLASGDNRLTFNAYLQGEPDALKNRTLGSGDFSAALTFALSYE